MKRFIAITLLVLTIPSVGYAATAGTDEYLRGLGYSDEQLSTEAATEKREAFFLAEGIGRVRDPLGDVLDRFGISSKLRQTWGDVSAATLTKDADTGYWTVSLTLGGAMPDAPSIQSQFFFYADTDGDATNNDPEGIRVGTDAEFSVRFDGERGWITDFRWYNPEADFWAVNKDTSATFERNGDTLTLRVPFAELPADRFPYWRTAVALADGPATQIDVAPGVGFPPPKGEMYPEDISTNRRILIAEIGAIAFGVSVLASMAFAKRFQKR